MKTNISETPLKAYTHIPEKWNNVHRYDLWTERHDSDGWRELIIPEYDNNIFCLGDIYYDDQFKFYTYQLVEKIHDLEELRSQKLNEFSSVLDEFTTLITRCKLIYGDFNNELNSAIEQTRKMQLGTVATINSIENVKTMLNFQIRPDDIEHYKSLFEPFRL